MVLVLAAAALAPRRASACATCGGGSDAPPALAAIARGHVRVGVARMGQQGYLRGGAAVAAPPAARGARDSVSLGVALAVGSRGVVGISVPVLLVEGAAAQASGIENIFVAARAALWRPPAAAPWWPQVQLVGSFRNAVGTAADDARRPDVLDAFGSSYDEVRGGVDLWWPAWPLRFGAAVQGAAAFARPTDAGSERPGAALRAAVTLAAALGAHVALRASYALELAAAAQVNGTVRADTARRVQALTGSIEVAPAPLWALSAEVGRVGLPGSRAAIAATTLGLAATRAW